MTTSGRETAILRNLLARTTRAYDEQVAELFAEKELAQVTLEAIDDGVITTDMDGLVTSFNPAAARLTGWNAADAIGQPLDQIFQVVDEESSQHDGLGGRTPEQEASDHTGVELAAPLVGPLPGGDDVHGEPDTRLRQQEQRVLGRLGLPTSLPRHHQ